MIILSKQKIITLVFGFLIFLTLFYIYKPSFNNFFFGDDFFNLSLSRINSPKEVINFFNLLKSSPDFPFYRPLTTQLFFGIGYKLFKLRPFDYHIIIFTVFVSTILILYLVLKQIINNLTIVFLAVVFYSFSASHFYRLNFLSQFQEIGMTFFYLLTVLSYLKFFKTKNIKYYFLSVVLFLISLTTKETAITLPLALLLADLCFNKNKGLWNVRLKAIFKNQFLFFLIAFVYLLLRIYFFGFSQGGAYQFIFNIKSIINNLLWYWLWSMGIPADYVNLRIKDPVYFINPGFLTEFGKKGAVTTVLFVIFLTVLLMAVRSFWKSVYQKNEQNNIKLVFFSIGWFIITLLLVSFFPFHKFSYSVTLPLLGVSLILAVLFNALYKESKTFFMFGLLVYLLANKSAVNYAFKTHWTVSRASLAENVYKYFQKNLPCLSHQTAIYFYDYNYCSLAQGSTRKSEELSYALSRDKALLVIYNKDIRVYYQYLIPVEEVDLSNTIVINVEQFFKKGY